MYKKELAIQKVVCLLCVVAAAICFVYSLGILTDLYDSLYATMRDPNNPTQTQVPGSIIYYDMQPFNKQFVIVSIGLILAGCLLFLTNTHVRRKYYIGNYAAIGIYTAAAAGVGIWSHLQIDAFKTQFLTTVDFEALKKFAETRKRFYTDSTFWFDAHYVVLAVLFVAVAALIANLIWKIILMRGEARLIAQGETAAKEASV